MRRLIGFAVLIALMSVGVACDTEQPSAQNRESALQQHSYADLVNAEPAHGMKYSPTRKTINFWIDTWDEAHKLAYVYLMASNGQLVGYFVFEGPPVSMCASLTPTYKLIDTPHDGSNQLDQQVPAPSADGVYYSGGQCNQYYGKDATSGAYLEFSIGGGINYLLYDQPLPRQNVEPLGFTTIQDVKG